MSTNFPTTLDQYATVPTNQALAVPHQDRHQNIEDAMEAVQAKVGVTNSAVTTSLDYRVKQLEESALVGNNWTQNAVPVGAADGSLDEVVLTPSTVLGRSSSGDAVAKTCSDLGFSFVAAVSDVAARTVINAQASDTTLTALAGYNTNGLLTQTAPDTFVGRSIAGTAGRITVTNGDGVAGNPTITIPTSLIDSGVYTPTFTNVTNVAANTPRGAFQWSRVGNTITVSGQVGITPTAAALAVTELRMSLPVASNFTSTNQCAGGGAGSIAAGTAQPALLVYSDSTNDAAVIRYNAPTTTITDCWVSFTYVVLP